MVNVKDNAKTIYGNLVKALNELQNPVNSQENPNFKNKYVPLADILDLAKPILSKYGFAILQVPNVLYEHIQQTGKNGSYVQVQEVGVVKVATTLIHESGEQIDFPEMIFKVQGNNPQAIGSAITYARRYSLSSILGISGKEEDDDGNISSGNHEYYQNPQQPQQNYGQYGYQNNQPMPQQVQVITQQQANELFGYANQIAQMRGVEFSLVVSSLNLGVNDLNQLPSQLYGEAKNKLVSWINKLEKEQTNNVAQNQQQKQPVEEQPTQQTNNPVKNEEKEEPQTPTTTTNAGYEQFRIDNIEKGVSDSNIPYCRIMATRQSNGEQLLILVNGEKLQAVEGLKEGTVVPMLIDNSNGFNMFVALGGDEDVA